MLIQRRNNVVCAVGRGTQDATGLPQIPVDGRINLDVLLNANLLLYMYLTNISLENTKHVDLFSFFASPCSADLRCFSYH